jgi:hypothetical protein
MIFRRAGRHGDRTAINLLPDEAGVHWDCAVRSRRTMGKAGDGEEGGKDRALHDDGAYLIDPDHPYAHDFWAGNCSNGQVPSYPPTVPCRRCTCRNPPNPNSNPSHWTVRRPHAPTERTFVDLEG